MMNSLKITLLLSALVAGCFAASGTFSYGAQGNWTGSCNSNTGRQSPIDIIGDDVQVDSNLTALVFSDGWSMPISNGVFENKGQTVQFTINGDSTALTVTVPGVGPTYTFLQAHFHWGTVDNTGAEHRFDGDQTELEIHFVNRRGEGENVEYAVVGVFAEASSNPISGPWSTLDASQITQAGTNITIENMMLGSMLPADSDYYTYGGSLTTPPCSEIVTFYLFREKIQVPINYLSLLRSLRNTEGNLIGLNFREPQDINERVVRLFDSGATVATVSVLSMLIMALATLLF